MDWKLIGITTKHGMAHKISDVHYKQRVQTLTHIFFSLMIPHEGQGNGSGGIAGLYDFKHCFAT